MNGTQTDAPYAAAWDEYRRRWRTIYLLLAGSAGCVLLDLLSEHFSHSLAFVFAVPFVALLWAAMFLNWRLWFWPCPRCGQWFFLNRNEANANGTLFLSWRCRHCRLPKGAVRDPE